MLNVRSIVPNLLRSRQLASRSLSNPLAYFHSSGSRWAEQKEETANADKAKEETPAAEKTAETTKKADSGSEGEKALSADELKVMLNDLVKETEEYKSRAEKCEGQISEMKEKFVRTLAEMENVRQVARRDVDNAKKFALQGFAKSLLEVSDNLGMAMDAVKPEELETNAAVKALFDGVKMTDTVMQNIFQKQGLIRYGDIGDKFDPNLHEAMFEVPSAEHDDATLSFVMKKGFLLHDRTLRPAQVGVYKNEEQRAAAAAAAATTAAEGEGAEKSGENGEASA